MLELFETLSILATGTTCSSILKFPRGQNERRILDLPPTNVKLSLKIDLDISLK